MTWTYDVSDLANSPKDYVRLLIGDKYASRPQLQDEEILSHISARANAYGAAAECCRTLATMYSSSVDFQASGTRAAYSQMAKAYRSNAHFFEVMAARSGAATPYAGGISISDVLTLQANADRMPTAFNIGMMDAELPVPPLGPQPEPVFEDN